MDTERQEAFLGDLAQATQDAYEFQHIPEMRGRKVPIQRICLPEIGMDYMHLLAPFMPEKMGGKPPAEVTPELYRKGIVASIAIVNDGCAWLKGRIHPDEESRPKEPGHWNYKQLGMDFWGLVYAIVELSGLGKERARRVRPFLGGQSSGADVLLDGAGLRDDPSASAGA